MKKFLTVIMLVASLNAVAESFTGIVEDVLSVPQGQRHSEECRDELHYNGWDTACKSTNVEEFIIIVSVRNTLYRFKTIHRYHKGDKVRVDISARLEDE